MKSESGHKRRYIYQMEISEDEMARLRKKAALPPQLHDHKANLTKLLKKAVKYELCN